MAEQKDHLEVEISVEAELTEKGVSAKARSRALAAFDRMIGSLLDIPAAHAERTARRIRADTDADVKLIQADATAAEAKLLASALAGDRALESLHRKQKVKLENKEHIVHQVIEELKALPPPNVPDGGSEELDDDWMNIFERHAEDASSDRLRRIWARVLAGEVRAPGSFALSTLRTISELDQPIAQTFQKWTARRWQGVIIKPEKLENEVLSDLTFLEEVGLLQFVDGTVTRSLEVGPGGEAFLSGERLGLLINAPAGTKLSFPTIPITRVGREIASILPIDEEGVFREMTARLNLPAHAKAWLCEISSQLGADIRYQGLKQLFPKG